MTEYLLLLGGAAFASLGLVLLTYGLGWWPFEITEDVEWPFEPRKESE